MRTQKSTWTMGLAVAFLMAMTSTLSAQAAESKGDITAPSSSQVSAGSAGFGTARVNLSGDGMVHVIPLVSGWCGTDTTLAKDPALMRVRAQLFAALFHAGMQLVPGQIVAKALAYRRWYSSSIDVAPAKG